VLRGSELDHSSGITQEGQVRAFLRSAVEAALAMVGGN
jgi:hypothetical protein